MRRAHILKENRGSGYPVRVIFFDTETLPVDLGEGRVEHKFRLGWACFWRRRPETGKDNEEWYRIEDLPSFWEWVIGKSYTKTRLYLVAHNLDFDLAVTGGYRAILAAGFKLLNHWEKGVSRFYHWKQGNRSIIGLDNANYFQGSLARLGKSLGVEKLEVDFEKSSEEEISVYCKRDVEIMVRAWQYWLRFCEQEDLGYFAPTLAGQAFNAFRHRFMPAKVFIHDNVRALELERECYKGGRSECFYLGRPPGDRFYYLDINSMYPYVMVSHYYPCRLIFYQYGTSMSNFRNALKRFLICAHVRVRTEVPAFPVRVKGKTFYPVGEFDCYLTTPEIEYLLQHGELLRVYAFAAYEKAYLFKDYVEYFYAKRLEARERGEDAFSFFFKIMLNSLYGKFGQKSTKWEKIGECSPEEERIEQAIDLVTGKRYWLRYHNGLVEQSKEEEEAFNSFPAIAAHVTAYARIYLQELISKAGPENVYYVDTDSLFVNEKGYQRLSGLLHPTELGKLKLEETGDTLVIRGPKDYTFGTHTKLKGIRSNAVEVAPGVYEQEKWLGFASRLREGKLNTYVVERQQKTLRRVYAKGQTKGEGPVKPWVLPQDWERVSRLL